MKVLFRRLAKRRSQFTRTLSGGNQQMVIGRALMTIPLLVVLDKTTQELAFVIR